MLIFGLATAIVQTPDWPLTRAERTNYSETSHYEDVVSFIRELEIKGAPIRLEWMGESTEGKKIPLVIASRPEMTPAQARRSGRPIIYIQANIHAGEVEGKEAALALLRDWSKSQNSALDKAVVLVAPIYNIDGNEKWGPVEKNRPEQDGPALVGVRANGQGLDLNRDCMKAESPEMQAVLAHVWKSWDPDVVMDLHTTDGTRHGYELTYAPGLNPNTEPAVMKYTRDELLPDVRRELRRRFGIELFDYGNVEGRGKDQAWRSFEPLGRYVTNYAGLRNRVAILSEATTFIPFKARVLATEAFVQSCVNHVLSDRKKVLDITRRADLWRPKSLGVQFNFDQRGDEDVLLEKLAPGQARPISGRPAKLQTVRMPIYDRFKAAKTAAVPAAYLVPANETRIVELLRRHGIEVERTLSPCRVSSVSFLVSKVDRSSREYQGHHATTLEGTFQPEQEREAPEGTYLVSTDQPLGTLAFLLLEPESADGVVAWEFLQDVPTAGASYPILKCPQMPAVATETVD